MPIPTPEPPVRRYFLKRLYRGGPYQMQTDPENPGLGDWCKWSEVEALLLQRAQEIAELNNQHFAALETLRYAESELEGWRAQAEKAEAQLTARAQEIEQVKAALSEAVGDLQAYGAAESTSALHGKDREQYQFWQGWNAALARVETTLARAALVSHAPQTRDGCRLNRPAFERMIAENRAWLATMPRSLERDHIDAILADSANRYYAAPLPASAALQALIEQWRKTEAPGVLSDLGIRAERVRRQCADELEAALSRADQP